MKFNELTSLRVTSRFRSGRNEVTPATVHYKLRNNTTNTTLVDWTEVEASPTVEIDLDAQDLVARSKLDEIEITIAADKGTEDQVTDIKTWQIRNLRGA